MRLERWVILLLERPRSSPETSVACLLTKLGPNSPNFAYSRLSFGGPGPNPLRDTVRNSIPLAWQRRMPSSKQQYQAVQADETVAPQHGDKIPLQAYVDDASSDEDDLASLDEPLEVTDSSSRRGTLESGKNASCKSRRPWQRACGCCGFSRTCLIITLLFVGAFIALLGGGGYWVYKDAPETGDSPPWYPSPKGGTTSTWSASYDKAKVMVAKMSLVEKVNITTGTGYVSCCGPLTRY